MLHGKKLANGLEILIDDQTKRYFGDYHQVRLVVTALIALADVSGLAPDELDRASAESGQLITHTRILEKMGVGSAEVPTVKQDLLSHFFDHALPYMEAEDFPLKMVHAAGRSRTKLRRY